MSETSVDFHDESKTRLRSYVNRLSPFPNSPVCSQPVQCCREEAASGGRDSQSHEFSSPPPLRGNKRMLLDVPKLPYGEKASLGCRSEMEDRTTYISGLITMRTVTPYRKCVIPTVLQPTLDSLVERNPMYSTQAGAHYGRVVIDALEKFDFAGVFDGHGGHEIAQALSERLPVVLQEAFSNACQTEKLFAAVRSQLSFDSPLSFDPEINPTEFLNNALSPDSLWSSMKPIDLAEVQNTLMQAFKTMDENLPQSKNKMIGSTAITTLISDLHIIVANVGDSRAVLSRGKKAYPLSRDHKPDERDEEQRIKQAGGKIWDFNGRRVMGLLAMTRAFGDTSLKQFGVSADPEITILPRAMDDDFLILACDGLWDVISDEEACRLVQRCFGRAAERSASQVSCCRVAATVLSRAAFERGSSDNVSVVVIDLRTL